MIRELTLVTVAPVEFLDADDSFAHTNAFNDFTQGAVDAALAVVDGRKYVARTNAGRVVRGWRAGSGHGDRLKRG